MKPSKLTRPAARADHADIVTLAVMIAARNSEGAGHRYAAAHYPLNSSAKQAAEQAAAHSDDDICQLCVRMKRLCNGDRTALEG